MSALTPCKGNRRNLANQTAFPDTGRSLDPNHSAVAVDGTVQHALDGRQFPSPTDKFRLSAPDDPVLAHAHQAVSGYWFVSTFDPNQLQLTESCYALN